MKKVLIIVTAILSFIISSYFILSTYIYNRKDCKQFNIDNIEVRTGINIPNVITSDCKCEGNIKKSNFSLDLKENRIYNYLNNNNFKKVDKKYLNKGKNEDTYWESTFDFKEKKLSILIKYLD